MDEVVNLPAVLAIDGGNSKTDALLLGRDGTVLGSARGPGASPQSIGVARSASEFERLAGEAAKRAGLPAGPPFARHTSAYLAGIDLPREEDEFNAELSTRDWSESTVVGNDTFALLRAGTPDGVGVAVVCGAGINCAGVSRDGRVHRFPALGRISGDWGGGAQLGTEALWAAVRAEDGRGPETALRAAVCAHFDVPRVSDVVTALHFRELPQGVLHELCPLLFDVAADGDEVAGVVVDRQIEEIVLLATVSARELGLLDDAVPVVLGGGVLAGVSDVIIDEITRRCRKIVPHAEVRRAELPPVAGAALLGLDAIGAAPSAEHTLRSTVRDVMLRT